MSRPTTCFRCNKTHSGPQAFLVTCFECHRSWHHRCHIPPISDEELITRIKATNEGDVDNGLSGWACRKCTREQANSRKPVVVAPRSNPNVLPVQPAPNTSNPTSNPQNLPSIQKDSAPKIMKYKQSAGHKGFAAPVRSAEQSAERVPRIQDTLPVPGRTGNQKTASEIATKHVEISTSSLTTASTPSSTGVPPGIQQATRRNDVVPNAPQKLYPQTVPPAPSTSRYAQPSRTGTQQVHRPTPLMNLTDDDGDDNPFSSNIGTKKPAVITRGNSTPTPSNLNTRTPSSSGAQVDAGPILKAGSHSELDIKPDKLLANEYAARQATKSHHLQSEASPTQSPSSSHAYTHFHGPLPLGRITPLASTHPSPQLPQIPELSIKSAPVSMKQHRTDEDVIMDDGDDDDDLYGPLPEDLEVPDAIMRSATDMGIDGIQVEREPFKTGSLSAPPENVPPKNYNRETSWMHGRYANVAGDSWDRLLRSKNTRVVGRLRTKVQAKKLDKHQAERRIKVEGLNFFIDEWLRGKKEV